MGDLDIFIIFGCLTVLGLAYAVTGAWHPEMLVLSLPIGLITVSVLHANNTLDIPTDKAAGIKTFAMVIGEKPSTVLYRCYMVLPFLCVIAAVIALWLPPLALLCLLAGFKACRNFRQAAGNRHVRARERIYAGSPGTLRRMGPSGGTRMGKDSPARDSSASPSRRHSSTWK